MVRKTLFVLLAFAAVLAIFSSIILLQPKPLTSSGMGQSGMMSGMMEESMSMPLLWPSILTISSAAILIGLTYAIAFPTIKTNEGAVANLTAPISTEAPRDPLAVLIRASKPDEGSVLQVLHDSGGVCRQKDIVFKTGLSKLKVHRVIARLAERRIVQVKRIGKMNEITLPSWLMQSQTDSHAL